MSRYVIRHVEAKYELIEGTIYNVDKLPKDAPEGTTYKAWNCEFKYYKRVNGEWVGQNSCQTEWRLLSGYQKTRKPKDDDEEWKKNATEEYKTSDGLAVYFLKRSEFANNGGAIRDDYISSHALSEKCSFKGRGIPYDISPETYEEMMYDMSMFGEKSEKRLRGYDHTWCTLSEWNELYDTEEERILNLIKEAYQKENNTLINKKLDYIINHMKDPFSGDPKDEIYKKPVDEDGNVIDDECDYYESPEYIIKEYMPNLYLIAEEIGRITQIAEWNGVWEDNLRIIYYIE